MMRRTNRGSRSSSWNTISLAMYNSNESDSVCAVTTCGRSMNMTASPKLCPGPIRSTTFSSPRGDEKVVDLIGPGQSFGEAVMFMERPHVVTAQTLSDSLLLYIAREIVFQELERDPRFVRRIIAGLSSRLHRLMSDLESDSLHSGTQRIIGYLLRDSEDNPESKNALEVTLSANKGCLLEP